MNTMKHTLIALAIGCASIVATPSYAHDTQTIASQTAKATPKQTSFGKAGDPDKVDRTIEIDMTDEMRFDPAFIEVQRGETIRFIVSNSGSLMHEIVLGTGRSLRQHAAEMAKHPDMTHSGPNMAHVMPGTSEEIIWNFNKKGVVHMACLIDGHDKKGMKGIIRVRAEILQQSEENARKSGQ